MIYIHIICDYTKHLSLFYLLLYLSIADKALNYKNKMTKDDNGVSSYFIMRMQKRFYKHFN